MAFTAKRGTNISHWLSQSRRRGAERRATFTRDDVALLSDAGLDHLRLPVDEEQLWHAGPVGEQQRDEEGFDLLHAALDWCEATGLTWGVDIVRQDVPYFDRVPMVSGDVPVPEGDLDGLQETVDNVRSVLGQSAITILCPFNWDGPGQIMAGENPSAKTYWSSYKSRLTAMADQF